MFDFIYKNTTNTDSSSNNDFIHKQLHEQYAQNNYNGLSSVVSMLVGLFAVFYAYGYVFINSAPSRCDDLATLVNKNSYTALALFLVTCAVCMVILIMTHICIYQGLFQRKEQFIIHAIRCKHCGTKDTKNGFMPNIDIFPENYTPFNKGKCCWLEIIQGLHGEFTKILLMVYPVIVISSTIRICVLNAHCWCLGLIELILLSSFGIIFYVVQKSNVKSDYEKRTNEFEKILNNLKK